MMKAKVTVVDSSVIVKWVNGFKEEDLDRADDIMRDVEKGKIKLSAPELSKYEVGNALIRKKMQIHEFKASLSTLYSLPIKFFADNEELSKMTAEISEKYKITYYDASFLSLAKKLKATLVTANPKHQKCEGVKVVELAKY